MPSISYNVSQTFIKEEVGSKFVGDNAKVYVTAPFVPDTTRNIAHEDIKCKYFQSYGDIKCLEFFL